MRRFPLLLLALLLLIPVACDKKENKPGEAPTTPPNVGGSKLGPPTNVK